MPPGVKGLAAMFEQRGENNSPDDRGRSPGPARSLGSPAPESPRPLSKIRSSFVAIEKDGRVGLRREHSGDSVSASSRRVSNDTGTTTPQPISEDVFAENMAQNATAFESNLSQVSSPKFVKQTPSPSKFSPRTPKNGDTTPDFAPNPNPDKITDEEETKAKLKPGMPTDKGAVEDYQHTSNGIGDILKPVAPTSKAKATTSSKPAPKPDPVSTASTKPAPRALKSPATITAAKSHTKEPARASSAAPEKKATSRATSASRERHATASKTAASKPTATAGKKPAAVTPPSSTGFVKPKPRSPTRPVKLPSSLTTPTAASAAKLGNGAVTAASPGRRPVSRASGGTTQNLDANPASHRPHSRTGASATGTTSGTKTLKRQSSTVGRPRPSLGPPPKQRAKDHPVAKREAHVDESFLARMMRPTRASASKTAEKSPLSPPRKHNAPAPAQPRRPVAKDVEGNAKKAAAKLQGPDKPKPVTGAAKKATAEEAKKTAKEVAPVVAQVETAEEAIETAKASKETAATPLVEKAEAEVPIEPTAQGVAPIVAQAETAEAAIGAAKVSTDTAVTPLVEKTESEAVVESTTEEEAGAPQDQTRPLSRQASPVPTVTAAPEKVEDIEELVKEAAEGRVDKTAPEDAAAEAAGDVKEAAAPSTAEAEEKPDQEKPNEE
ncbi:hypothetical protein DL766_003651 [Monosporascus sp. MC13-8B]|uniref:Mucin-7 n=1 Tax=Monosporascus cannonballus TaxID=155416 RepID=A0ABY0H6D7_9PEZI|nr:hypothetical protein DL762_004936 [Monosporascus cannonballus]RYP33151.1 hypothetical protein DL766_003651 [Monosporascus sp. MC13-8B]